MNLLFDFDGTICDGINVAIDILNLKFKELGKPQTSLKELRSKGLKHILGSREISSEQVHATATNGRKIFGEKIPFLKTFPGLPKVIEKLAKKHFLGILISNSVENVHLFLKNHKMDEYFKFVENEQGIFGKQNLMKILKADYYISDETRDIEAARKAGVKSVAVTWGAESERLLAKSKPDFLILEPKQLLKLSF